MESKLHGEVICSDLRRQPRTVHRFVQKWLERWLEVQVPLALQANGATFHVTFDRLGAGHAVGCQVRLAVGGQLWTGFNYGPDIAAALKHALNHMVPQMSKVVQVQSTPPQPRA